MAHSSVRILSDDGAPERRWARRNSPLTPSSRRTWEHDTNRLLVTLLTSRLARAEYLYLDVMRGWWWWWCLAVRLSSSSSSPSPAPLLPQPVLLLLLLLLLGSGAMAAATRPRRRLCRKMTESAGREYMAGGDCWWGCSGGVSGRLNESSSAPCCWVQRRRRVSAAAISRRRVSATSLSCRAPDDTVLTPDSHTKHWLLQLMTPEKKT